MASLYLGHSPLAMHSQSRIPRMRINNSARTPKQPSIPAKTNDTSYQKATYSNQLSPLQKLQQEYQEKLQIEKEKKMTFLYEKWSDEALKRVEQHSGNRNHRIIPKASKLKKPDGYAAFHQKRLAISANQRMRHRKPQKLPPLNSISKAQSFHTSNMQTPPARVVNHDQSHITNIPEEQQISHNNKIEDGNISPPPNIQHLRLLRERRLQQKKLMRNNIQENSVDDNIEKSKSKLTEFEKWQQEQDAGRMARLQRNYTQQNTNNLKQIQNRIIVDATPPLAPHTANIRPKQVYLKTMKTRRSISPVTRKQPINRTQQKIINEQNDENSRRIAELEKEMKLKQMDLKKIQNREKRSRLDSSGNGTSGSENDSDHELLFSTSHTPVLKPVKVTSKRYAQSNHSIFSDEDDGRNSGFQMKPVLVRRDQSRESNRSTPKNNKTYVTHKPKVKQNLRNRKFMSPNLQIDEYEPNKFPVTPPISTNETPENTHSFGQYTLDKIENGENVILHLIPCRNCGRKFTDDRLAKHTKVCVKTQNKIRKVFDMTRVRTEGMEVEKYARQNVNTRNTVPPRRKMNWRLKHEEFIRTIRDAKAATEHIARGGKYSDLPPPKPSENPEYVKCQYCKRKFDPAVADRHIPRCKDIKSRPKPPPRR